MTKVTQERPGETTIAEPVDVIIQVDGTDVDEGNPLPVYQGAVDCAAADVHGPAVNTAAVVTYVASPGVQHVISGVAWSYNGGIPVGGSLVITDAGATVFTVDISEEGPGFFTFPRPKQNAIVNTAMVITLAAGGAGITGKVNILSHWTE